MDRRPRIAIRYRNPLGSAFVGLDHCGSFGQLVLRWRLELFGVGFGELDFAEAHDGHGALVGGLDLDGKIDCVFTAEQIIARWSVLGIKPGDWLAIGASMALQGDRLQNPVPLKIGSTLRCASPVIGELSHQVVAAGGTRR